MKQVLPALFLLLCVTTHAADPKPNLISPEVKIAVDKAVAWLVRQQKPAG
jgi:hypothetical protein